MLTERPPALRTSLGLLSHLSSSLDLSTTTGWQTLTPYMPAHMGLINRYTAQNVQNNMCMP